MKVHELIERLREFDPELEVEITVANADDVSDFYEVVDIEDEGSTLFIEVE